MCLRNLNRKNLSVRKKLYLHSRQIKIAIYSYFLPNFRVTGVIKFRDFNNPGKQMPRHISDDDIISFPWFIKSVKKQKNSYQRLAVSFLCVNLQHKVTANNLHGTSQVAIIHKNNFTRELNRILFK